MVSQVNNKINPSNELPTEFCKALRALRCAGLLTGDYLSDGLTITQTGLDVLRVLENEEETHDC